MLDAGPVATSAVQIHPTAIVDPGAELGAGVVVGPFSIVGPEVRLGDRVRLQSHVVVTGRTSVGADTVLYPFAAIGHQPQDLKYHGELSRIEIGARNQIREHVTIHPGTEGGGMLTKVGDDCLLMVAVHVAHDCTLGNRVVMANNATLAGHVVVGDFAVIGGLSAVHQHVRIGAHAMVGGMSGVEQDVIPYGLVMGDRARLSGLNLVGLERRGFPRADIQAMRSAYRMLFGPDGTLAERLDSVAQTFPEHELIADIVGFVRAKSARALCQPRTHAS